MKPHFKITIVPYAFVSEIELKAFLKDFLSEFALNNWGRGLVDGVFKNELIIHYGINYTCFGLEEK